MTERWTRGDNALSPSAITAAHAGLTVTLIATPVDQLMTCHMGERVADVLSRNTEPFDFLPVRDSAGGEGRIIGLLHAAAFAEAASLEGEVGDHLVNLTEAYVIGGDASILDFVQDADERPCRLVFSGPRISGLVSQSDLQRLPVRAALFAVITGLEMTMAEVIRRHHPNDESWINCLSQNRRESIEKEIAKTRRDDGFVDALLFSQFCDKATIVRKTVRTPLSKKSLKDKLDRLERLRNNIAHANEYAATRTESASVSQRLRDLFEVQAMIAAAFPGEDAA